MRREVCSSDVSESAAYEDVGGEMLLPANPGQADSRRQPESSPLKPKVVRIAVGNHAGKREAGGSVSRRKRLAALPKFTLGIWMICILAVRRRLQPVCDDIRRAYGFECSEASVRSIRLTMSCASEQIHQACGAKFDPQSNVRSPGCGLRE